MAKGKYVAASGFVQWTPDTREANNQQVLDFTIKAQGSEGVNVQVTVWPELQTPAVLGLEVGDFVAVDGKLNVSRWKDNDGNSRESVQISANYIAVVKGEKKAEREVVNAGTDDDDLF